ncbi:hypothetical protein RB195_018208 [Necator americanus]|uniref:PQ loop repeat protein n=1 Tax=Necator americanus TaxID=51031 RepID=A0ABR1CBR0_NECAM
MKNGGLVIHDLTADDYNCTNGIQWIERIFSDCVDTELKLLGFIIGIISLLLWLVPLLPQLLQNYRTKKCEGLSLTFLFLWLVGDTCNMLGAMLTHQTPIQQIIGVYYIFQDLALWGQYGYYTKVYPKLGSQRSSTIVVPCIALSSLGSFCLFSNNSPMSRVVRSTSVNTMIAVLFWRQDSSDNQELSTQKLCRTFTINVLYYCRRQPYIWRVCTSGNDGLALFPETSSVACW